MKYICFLCTCFLIASCQSYDELSLNENKFYIKKTEYTHEVIESIRQAGFKIKEIRPSTICKDSIFVIVKPEDNNAKQEKLKALHKDLEIKNKISGAN